MYTWLHCSHASIDHCVYYYTYTPCSWRSGQLIICACVPHGSIKFFIDRRSRSPCRMACPRTAVPQSSARTYICMISSELLSRGQPAGPVNDLWPWPAREILSIRTRTRACTFSLADQQPLYIYKPAGPVRARDPAMQSVKRDRLQALAASGGVKIC